MDYKKTIVRLVVSLLLSPVVFYIVFGAAELAGAHYTISDGEAYIIWVLMAILINMSITYKPKS